MIRHLAVNFLHDFKAYAVDVKHHKRKKGSFIRVSWLENVYWSEYPERKMMFLGWHVKDGKVIFFDEHTKEGGGFVQAMGNAIYDHLKDLRKN